MYTNPQLIASATSVICSGWGFLFWFRLLAPCIVLLNGGGDPKAQSKTIWRNRQETTDNRQQQSQQFPQF